MKPLEDTEPSMNPFGGMHDVEEWLISQNACLHFGGNGFFIFFAFLIIEEERGIDLLEYSPYHPCSLWSHGEE